jgi:hypothetical protein
VRWTHPRLPQEAFRGLEVPARGSECAVSADAGEFLDTAILDYDFTTGDQRGRAALKRCAEVPVVGRIGTDAEGAPRVAHEAPEISCLP